MIYVQGNDLGGLPVELIPHGYEKGGLLRSFSFLLSWEQLEDLVAQGQEFLKQRASEPLDSEP